MDAAPGSQEQQALRPPRVLRALTARAVFRYCWDKPTATIGREDTGMKSVASMLTGLALLGMSAAPSWAQEHAQDYPTRQVNFVVPFAPGGGTDILGRLVGQKLSERFGKPFVVENRPGAGTVTAAVQVARSTPDGYTIMMATSS